MLRLNTFGGLSLESDSPLGGSARHRKRLALLALLAGPRAVSRDKVVGHLWPEMSEARARHALAQALYALRRDLHADDLVLGTGELRLNPDVISTDLGDFEAAISRGDWAAAVPLYKGPFLDGVFVNDAHEFDRWASDQRTRLERECVRAFEQLLNNAVTPDAALEVLRKW